MVILVSTTYTDASDCDFGILTPNSFLVLGSGYQRLHPAGPSTSFRYPANECIVMVTVKDILTVVDPRTRTGRVYTLSKKETKAATDKFSRVQ